jgi:hypothetical protein
MCFFGRPRPAAAAARTAKTSSIYCFILNSLFLFYMYLPYHHSYIKKFDRSSVQIRTYKAFFCLNHLFRDGKSGGSAQGRSFSHFFESHVNNGQLMLPS